MSLPEGANRVAARFARAVTRRRWDDILPLLTDAARARLTADLLAAELAWEHLGPRLRSEFITASGEPEEIVPHLDPPKRFDVYEVEEHDPPGGHDPTIPVGWVEVTFEPAESSEFDVCYRCFLAFIDEGGPKITAFLIESPAE